MINPAFKFTGIAQCSHLSEPLSEEGKSMLVIIYATDFNPLCKDGSIPVPPPTMKMAGKEEKAAFD